MIRVKILGRILEYSNDKKIIIDMFEEINNIIMISGYMLSHLNIDGINVYENHQKVIEENIEKIDEIKVVLVSKEDILRENINELIEYVERLYNQSLKIGKKYYLNDVNEYKDVVDVMEGIMFVQKTLNVVGSHVEIKNVFRINEIIQNYNIIFTKIEKCMVANDLVSMGDIFSVEIRGKAIELLKEIKAIEL
ncbi:MAG: hypothetical protein N4A76_12300 [Firmicutes bacterium]|jgi:hypothetical protein|nr:hypothetical protein [Bacillota bacterium]